MSDFNDTMIAMNAEAQFVWSGFTVVIIITKTYPASFTK